MPQSKRSGGSRAALTSSQCSAVPSGLPEPRQRVEAIAGRLREAAQRRDRGVRGDAAEAIGVLRAQAQRAEPAHRQAGDRQRRRPGDAIVGQRGGGRDLLDDPAFVVGVGVRDVAAAEAPQAVGRHRQRDGRDLLGLDQPPGGQVRAAVQRPRPGARRTRRAAGSATAAARVAVPIGGAQKQMSARRPSARLATVIMRRPSRSKRGSESSTEAKDTGLTRAQLTPRRGRTPDARPRLRPSGRIGRHPRESSLRRPARRSQRRVLP